jgi:hypothetical protein
MEHRLLLTTLVVNSLGDTGSGNGLSGDLRYCLTIANQTQGSNSIDLSHISGAINLTSALPVISNSMTIIGPGASNLTLQRSSTTPFRILTIDQGTVVKISGLTLTGGSVPGGNGGAIDNDGTLTVSTSTITSNSALNGGGIANEHDGKMTLRQVTITNNWTVVVVYLIWV